MRKIVALALLCVVVLLSCRKEKSASLGPEDRAQASIELDGETFDVTYSGDVVNPCEMYTFAGSAGYYYGISSFFRLSEKENLQIIFGTLRTDSTSLDERAFLRLIEKGERSFGSLGAFNSYPRLESGKVEIAFVDKKSKRWCSTEITEVDAGHGLETTVKIHQPDGKFVIEEVEKVHVEGTDGFRVKGRFKCFMYEVNGRKKKNMTGKFIGVVTLK